MKKTLFAIAALAVFAVGCIKEEQQPTASSDSAGKPAIVVSVVQTKVSLSPIEGTDQGKCIWREGDQLAVYYQNADESAGEIVTFTYSEDYEDGTAKFVADADPTEGYVPVKVAHPVESLTEEGGFTLVREFTYDASNSGKLPVYLRSEEISLNEEGMLSAQLHHNASVLKFVLHDVPAYAAGLAFESVRYKDEGGNIVDKADGITTTSVTTITHFPYKTGYTADPASSANDVTLYVAAAHSSYPSRVYLIDGDGDEVEGSAKTFNVADGAKWIGADDYIEFNTPIDFKNADSRTNYVKVGGVKWAKGNLQCVQNEGDAGFQSGWRIAPAQWHHLTYKDNSEAGTVYTYTNSETSFEHFNYGGIANQARSDEAGDMIAPASEGLDISGKMYSDVTAATEVTGTAAIKEIDTFSGTKHNELWGDLAYWASKGAYKMPTAADMKKLHNEVHKESGVYTTADGKKVWGLFLTTVLPGETRKQPGTTPRTITDVDLEYGLFLPKAGRRYNVNSNYVIQKVLEQGTYRTSTYYGKATHNGTEYDVAGYYHIPKDYKGKLYYGNGLGETVSGAYGTTAGYLIRPVLVEAEAE